MRRRCVHGPPPEDTTDPKAREPGGMLLREDKSHWDESSCVTQEITRGHPCSPHVVGVAAARQLWLASREYCSSETPIALQQSCIESISRWYLPI